MIGRVTGPEQPQTFPREGSRVRLKADPAVTGRLRYYFREESGLLAVVAWDNDPEFKIEVVVRPYILETIEK
jgi:hypothetical protein